MKIFLSIYLILSHLFSTVGLNLDVHICNGERSFSIFSIPVGSTCGCDHSLESVKKKCCENKKLEVKSQKNESTTCSHFLIKQSLSTADFQKSPFEFTIRQFVSDNNSLIYNLEDPPDHSPPLFILYRHLLI